MSDNRPDFIKDGSYKFIDFNFYLPDIETYILNSFYGIDENLTLNKISDMFYYELLSKLFNHTDYKTIPVFSKLNHHSWFSFCSLLKFEEFYFQKAQKINNTSPLSVVLNYYNTFYDFKNMKLADKESLIIQGKYKSLKNFYKMLDNNNLKNFKDKIKTNPNYQKCLFNN